MLKNFSNLSVQETVIEKAENLFFLASFQFRLFFASVWKTSFSTIGPPIYLEQKITEMFFKI